jgi:hypothetical protein
MDGSFGSAKIQRGNKKHIRNRKTRNEDEWRNIMVFSPKGESAGLINTPCNAS